jgi:hypothetical protein
MTHNLIESGTSAETRPIIIGDDGTPPTIPPQAVFSRAITSLSRKRNGCDGQMAAKVMRKQ